MLESLNFRHFLLLIFLKIAGIACYYFCKWLEEDDRYD